MSGGLEITQWVFAGLGVHAGLHSWVAYSQRRGHPEYLSFGALCFSLALIAGGQARAYAVDDVVAANYWWRLVNYAVQIHWIFLVAFVGQIAGRSGRVQRWIRRAISLYVLGNVAVHALFGRLLYLEKVTSLERVEVAWTGDVLAYPVGPESLGAWTTAVGELASLGYIGLCTYWLYRDGKTRVAAVFSVLLALLGLMLIFDLAETVMSYEMIGVGTTYMLCLVVFMSMSLSVEMQDIDRLSALTVQLESRVLARGSALTRVNRELVTEVERRQLAEEERAELQRRLVRGERLQALGQFAGGISHDFNNLLTVLGGNVDMLRGILEDEGVEISDELELTLHDLEGATTRASNLTRELLTFSRQEIGPPQLISPRTVLFEMRTILEALLPPEIELGLNLNKTDLKVRVDPTSFERIVVNLVVNARDAIVDAGRIGVALEELVLAEDLDTPQGVAAPGRYLELMVQDTGSGMPAEVEGRIFEPFFSTKEVGEGTGLGLATVHGILEAVGGHAVIDTEPGKGTCFRIRMPVAQDDEDAAQPPAA